MFLLFRISLLPLLWPDIVSGTLVWRELMQFFSTSIVALTFYMGLFLWPDIVLQHRVAKVRSRRATKNLECANGICSDVSVPSL